MYVVKRTSLISLSILLSIILVGCSGGDEPTKSEKVTKLLTQGGGKWSANSITLADTDVKDELFPGFEITFSTTQISTLGTSPVWPASDTWSFKDKNADVIIRHSDDREIKIISINSTQLIIQMEWDQTTHEGDGSKAASLPGVYQFILTK